MSLLSSQIKELREAAEKFEGYQCGEVSRMLREASDTIESLRERLQATSEACEDVSTKNGIFKCSKCGCTVEEDGVDWGEIHYCPDCGKWVKR